MSNTQADLMVNMNVTAWEMQNKRFGELLDKLTDEQLLNETSPGRNTGVYIVGHMVAVHDDMKRLFGLGEKTYPDYVDIFIKSPDKSGKQFPTVAELKLAYHKITNELNNDFSKYSTEDWLGKHTAVTEEDFAKEPTRNKLNVLISRTNHLAGHLSQMLYLNK